MIPDAFCLPSDVQIEHLEKLAFIIWRKNDSRCLLSSSRCSDCTLHLEKLAFVILRKNDSRCLFCLPPDVQIAHLEKLAFVIWRKNDSRCLSRCS